MAESSNYSRSVMGGSDEDYSRSVLRGSDKEYSRSVLGGSDVEYSRFVRDGSDKEYSRSVLGGSDVEYSRSVRGGSDKKYSRSLLGGSDVDYSQTIVSGSDEAKEAPCEPCQNEGNVSAAVKYCDDCSEYLCGPCSKHHINFKAFRHHVVKDVETVKPVIKEGNTKITDISTDKIGQLDINSEQVQNIPGHVISSLRAIRKVTANLVSTIDVNTSNDNSSPPTINNLTVVQTHYCVVTDNINKSVKVVDTRARCVTSQIQLSDAVLVWSMTSVNDDQVAVSVTIEVRKNDGKFMFFTTNTTKYVGKILWFSVSASGIISDSHKSIDMKSAYDGIAHCNDRFYAAISSRIDVISMQGQIITTFTNKSFSRLCGIALSNDHNTLYVCSWYNDTVFSVDLDGNVTASYKDNDLQHPWGITVDSDGYIYVGSMDTRCVHQLTADLNKVQVIIKDVGVWSCAFNKNDNSLYVSKDKIKVYNLN